MKQVSLLCAVALLGWTAAAHAVPPEEETVHVVEAGETLGGIANRAEVSQSAIIEANGLEPPYVIKVGQKLDIPRGDSAKPATSSSTDTSPPSGTSVHVVEAGETLGGIASRQKVPRILIAEANRLTPPYTIKVGQKLLIPRTRHHVVKDGDTGFAIAYEYAVPWNNIAVANGIEPDSALKTGQKLLIPTVFKAPEIAPEPQAKPVAPSASRFAWPVQGPIRRGFRSRSTGAHHDGLDITAPRGTAVRAVAAGTVIFARNDPKQFGNLVVVDHGDDWHSAYASLSRITVKKGHKVAKGERVGLVGDTSITRKTELHFELRQGGKPVDPLGHLPKSR